MKDILKLYQYRYLLWMWIVRDIKIRYKQSLLGAAWAVLQPLSLMIIFTLVFSFFVKIPTDGIPYPLFAYVGILPWTLFSTSISFGVPNLVTNMNIITKIYFPREILAITPICSGVLDFFLGFIFFMFVMLLYQAPLHWTIIWIPLLMVVQLLFALGITLFASAVNVFFRDIRYVVPLVIQLWFYATPVIYPASSVPAWLQPYYALNPMVGIIDGYRRVILLGQPPSLNYLAVSVVMTVLILVLAYRYFKTVEWKFADMI